MHQDRFFHGLEYFFDNRHVSCFVVGFLDEVHLFFSFVVVKNMVDLLERYQTILFGGNEDSWTVDVADYFFQVHLINIEVGL